jgi:predicted XRE-type DNA-binding protein
MSNDENPPTFEGPFESAFELSDDDTRTANLKVRARLMDHLHDHIRDRDLTQEEAAERFGVPQSRISLLVNGRISKFTIDYLVNMCSRAGIEVELSFGRAKTGLE